MTADCSLCACAKIDGGDVLERLLADFWPEGGDPDYDGLKRVLEAEYDLSLTATEVRQHTDRHVSYGVDSETLDGLAGDREGGSR